MGDTIPGSQYFSGRYRSKRQLVTDLVKASERAYQASPKVGLLPKA